ncbi:MAG: glycosyl hydrolase family 8 [Mycobacteriales bacterium]
MLKAGRLATVLLCFCAACAGSAPAAPRAGSAASRQATPRPTRTIAASTAGRSCTSTSALRARARRFLRRYDSNGRIVRLDQGGDTVSEGQAYGMLIAQLAGDSAAFARIWSWTDSHLMRSDGLLSWHWAGGRVTGRNSAADADLLAAWALLRDSGPGSGAYHAAGRRMAAAILAHETAQVAGAYLLVAGNWAVNAPVTVDPSYWAWPAFADLQRLTGDPAWGRLASGALTATAALTKDGARLPPDWAELQAGSLVAVAAPPPSSGGTPLYGPDAQRLVLWANASNNGARRLAARWWSLLREHRRSQARELSLTGSVVASDRYPLAAMASAAAAQAASDSAAQTSMCRASLRLAAKQPTYYGDAWAVLGPALLTGKLT